MADNMINNALFIRVIFTDLSFKVQVSKVTGKNGLPKATRFKTRKNQPVFNN